jgi:hypothetical protein
LLGHSSGLTIGATLVPTVKVSQMFNEELVLHGMSCRSEVSSYIGREGHQLATLIVSSPPAL